MGNKQAMSVTLLPEHTDTLRQPSSAWTVSAVKLNANFILCVCDTEPLAGQSPNTGTCSFFHSTLHRDQILCFLRNGVLCERHGLSWTSSQHHHPDFSAAQAGNQSSTLTDLLQPQGT